MAWVRLCIWMTGTVLTQALWAADVVELQGGDRLTGSAVKIADGNLHFLTAHAEAPLRIAWESVARLSLDQEAQRGADLRAAASAIGRESTAVERDEPVGKSLSVSADFGQSYSGLSQYNQLSSNAELEYKGGRWDGSLVTHYNYYGGTEDAGTSYQTYGRMIAQRYLQGDGLFVFPYAFLGRQTEADGSAGQIRQYGGGIGWTFQRHQPDQISVLGGLVRSRGDGFTINETGRSDLSVDDLLAVGGVSWDQTLSNKVELSLRLYYFKPLGVPGHHAMATDASAKIPLYGPAYFTVRAYDTPELRQRKLLSVKNLQLSSGIGIEF